MAAMDQGKLNSMVSSINAEAGNYVRDVESAVRSLLDTFNNNWVSKAAQELATEVKGCLDSLATAVTTTFSNKNEAIRMSVSNFNIAEKENITYSGFSFDKPTVDLTLNSTLPNGKVGVADGADLNSINTPMGTLVTNVSGILDSIVTKVKNADAFDSAEQEALSTSITNIKNKFVTDMGTLKDSLSTRMSGEIATRDELNSTNYTNLSA